LQKALREVLGEHVEQAGSEVSRERLRFDFTHFSGLTAEEKNKIERIVNQKIYEGLLVSVTETTPDEARNMGAMALFGEKYGEKVRVVNMGGYSVELCGGTHVDNTLHIGLFKLVSENSVASGVRRIEAVTGTYALDLYREAYDTLSEACALGKTTPSQLAGRIESLLKENKQLKKDLTRGATAKDKSIKSKDIKTVEYKGFTIIAEKTEGLEIEDLRNLADELRTKIGSGILLLCGIANGSAQFIASASEDAVKAGVHCGQVVKAAAAVCGGGGGGQPHRAQAGGKDISKADEALAKGLETIKGQIK
jgi:alanyl-tRNA synthetase